MVFAVNRAASLVGLFYLLGCGQSDRPQVVRRDSAATPQPSVLERIDAFRTNPVPTVKGLECGEPWECQAKHGFPVPDNQHALAIDICALVRKELDADMKPKRIKASDVKEIVSFYVTRPYADLPGLRPWFHQAFMRSLSPSDRERLSVELTSFIQDELSSDDCG